MTQATARDLTALLTPIDGKKDSMLADITKWANINSGSANLEGLEIVAAEITPHFQFLGFDKTVHDAAKSYDVNNDGDLVEIPRGPVYQLSKRPHASRRIVMGAHLDTVFPKSHPFQTCEIVDHAEHGQILHGPGTADIKGGIRVMLEAISCFEKSPYAADIGIDVILNSDEETGSYASSYVFEKLGGQGDIGMVFEPALPDGTLAGARAGSGHYQFVVRGKAAHAGREFHNGRNAILGAGKVMDAINQLNGQRDGVTLNLGVISGGQATNVVPDLCIIRMNIRARKTEDLNWADENIRRVIDEGTAASAFGEDIQVELHGGTHRPVKEMIGGTKALFELVRDAGAELGLKIAWQATGGCCDGNNLADAGLPNVDTLGVRGAHIHSPEEYMVIDSLEERAKLAAMVMLKLGSDSVTWPERLKPKF